MYPVGHGSGYITHGSGYSDEVPCTLLVMVVGTVTRCHVPCWSW